MNRITEKVNGIYTVDSDYYNENTHIRLTGTVVDKLAEYENLEEKLIEKYHKLKNNIDSDSNKDVTGYKNDQIELLEQILKINDSKECIS